MLKLIVGLVPFSFFFFFPLLFSFFSVIVCSFYRSGKIGGVFFVLFFSFFPFSFFFFSLHGIPIAYVAKHLVPAGLSKVVRLGVKRCRNRSFPPSLFSPSSPPMDVGMGGPRAPAFYGIKRRRKQSIPLFAYQPFSPFPSPPESSREQPPPKRDEK